MNRPSPLLEMSRISKSFPGVQVLQDIDFNLQPSETHILAGENGAGKTTLIKIIAGVHTDYKGEIHLRGRRVRFRSPHEAAACGVSAIHQDMSVVNSMTVLDNIFLGRERTRGGCWMDRKSQRKKAASLLKQLSLDISLERPLEDYPVSVRQMVEIAKALVHNAKILIMDEPTSALNSLEVERLFSVIRELKSRGCGIIFISHRLVEMDRIGDRISVLRDGRSIGTTPASDIDRDTLIHWMVGRRIEQQFPKRRRNGGDIILTLKRFSLTDPAAGSPSVLKDVSLHLQAGEIVGIAGLQGSGKSELLNGLFGSYGPLDSKGIELFGRPFSIRSPRRSIEAGIALLTNDRKRTGLVPAMTIAHNLTLASLDTFFPHGWINASREKYSAEKDITRFDVRARSPGQEVRTLSGGNQQKVVLAKWLRTHPKVLLLDEPTIGVDVGAKQEIYEWMNRWTDEGIGILLVTSELPELLAMSDRIIVLHRGRMTAEFAGKDATQETIIQAAMGEGQKH